jgi:alkylation response protein AidB-like acyl-CoA dehydrogenase
MLDLTFTPEQDMLRDMARSLFAENASLDVVRKMEDDPVGYPAELWRQMAELDLLGLLVPTEHGGSGMSLLDGVALYEELGRALVPSPHFVSSVVSAGLLAQAGSSEQQAEWLPRICSGDAILTAAWLEPGNSCGPTGVQMQATADGDGVRLNGIKRHVAFAAAASRLVVLARTGEAPTDVDLFLVDPQADGVTLTQQMSLASDTQYQVAFEDAAVPRADRIGAPGTGWAAWHQVSYDALILLAAWAVGAADYAQEITVQYAQDRHQFDKPLGAFQSIAHYLADRQTELDGARTLVHEAAWARATDRPVERLAPMAKLFAGKTFRDVTATAQQIFGGVGFTVEYDIQLYFRRAKVAQVAWWEDRYLEELIAADVLD